MRKKQEDYRIFPISQSQRNIWELEHLTPNSPMNNICTSVRIKGHIDVELIKRCLNYILENDLSLRTRIAIINDNPYQFNVAYKEEDFPFYDFSMTDKDGIMRWENTVAQTAMQICESPLYQFFIYKTDEDNGGILIKVHHLICDGWSIVNLINQISSAYLALLSHTQPEFEILNSYENHVVREKEYINSDNFEYDKEYWEKEIEEYSSERAFLKKNNNVNISYAGERCSFQFSEVLNHAITDFCEKNRVAPFTVYCIALAVHMRRMSDCDNISLGVPIMNRSEYIDKHTGGMYVSTLPFFFKPDINLSVEETIINLTEKWYDLLRHQKFPFSEIFEIYNQTNKADNKMFDVALSYQDGKIFRNNDATMLFSGKWIYSGYQNEHLIIHLSSLDGEGRFAVDYDYLTQIYSCGDIEDLHKHITKILLELLLYQKTPIRELNLLDIDEFEKVIYTFNKTDKDNVLGTINEKFINIIDKAPDTVAVICDDKRITYNELYKKALNIASHIYDVCRGKNEEENVIAICLPRGFDLIASMLAASFSGNGWVVLTPEIPKARFSYILQDSGAALLVTDIKTWALIDADNIGNNPTEILFIDELENLQYKSRNNESFEIPANISAKTLAYIVYTSGSTGTPKGVMIEQRSLLNFSAAMDSIYANGGVLSFSNISFDVFNLETISALLCGQTIILARDDQYNDPTELAGLIKKYAANFFAITPSRLEAYISNQEFAGALINMECIVCGGEPLTGDFLQKLEKYTKARIYNQYGPTETTIGVSCKRVSQSPSLSAGKPMQNCNLYVLDDNMKPLPVGAIGELYIGGDCVGRGYLNNEEATNKNFVDNKFKINQRMYRTGDIACWDKNGEINILGRHDTQLKLNGYRIESQEIISAMLSHPQITQATINVFKKGNVGYIAAYYTSQNELDYEKLFETCSVFLPAYMIPQFFIWVESIPLTENGKIDFKKLPEPKEKSDYKITLTQTQNIILNIYKRILDRNDLTLNSSFFQSGGNSLNALTAIARIENETGRTISFNDLRNLSTPLNIADKIDKNSYIEEIKHEHKITSVNKTSYPLTSIQKSILFSSFSDSSGIAYNMPGGFILPFEPDITRIENTFRQLIEHEDILRISFEFEGAEAVAKVHDTFDFSIQTIKACDYEEALEQFVKPFDLFAHPLIRAALWSDGDKHILMIDVHHIINDGEGTAILLSKFDKIYTGQISKSVSLPDNRVSYKDYAYYMKKNSDMNKQSAYWENKLSDLGEKLDLPTDFSHTGNCGDKGESVLIKINKDLSSQIDGFCNENNMTPYTLFIAVYRIVLSAISGQKDFIIGTAAGGRILQQTHDMIGPFINTLPQRYNIDWKIPAIKYLQDISQDIADMLDNMDIDQEKYISSSGTDRSKSHEGLYNVMFLMRPAYEERFSLAGNPIAPLSAKSRTVKMDMAFECVKNKDEYSFSFEYRQALFNKNTIELYSRSFITAVEDIINNPDKKIQDIETVSSKDRLKLQKTSKDTSIPHIHMTIDSMADYQAYCDPDSVAVVFGEERLSHKEFKQRSDSIAAQLTALGVKKGDIVGVYCDRSPELLCGIYGILKCGGAYLPLTHQLPKDRISQMLDIAGARVILSDGNIAGFDFEKYTMCVISSEIQEFIPVSGRDPSDIAQVLFTSGTTGMPKGIMISHRALSSLITNLKRIYTNGGVDYGVLCSSNILFDSFTIEGVLPIAMGVSVIMADQAEIMNPWMLGECIKKSGAQHMVSTPSRIRMLLGDSTFKSSLLKMKVIILGGETVSADLAHKLCSACNGDIYNLYGPAEASVFVSGSPVKDGQTPTIGYTMPNARIYLLDDDMRMVMPTAQGEIYIGGECLSEGYSGRPDLTQEAFVDDPFIPGEKLYRTGDMARMLADGQLVFTGRKDFQVKLNGQRVELDEITGCIINTKTVKDAAVIMVKGSNEESGNILCAFVVPADKDKFNDKNLREEIGKKLPQFMIPAKTLTIDKIPLTATGKIDRNALVSIHNEGSIDENIEQNVEDAENIVQIDINDKEALREVLINLWKKVLASEKIDEDKSFFEQGGTSLSAMNLLVQYFKQGWQVKLAAFYEKPTLNEQIELICNTQEPTVPQTKVETPQPLIFQDQEKETVLVTGAKGFLGAHIVHELICKGNDEIYCLIRGIQSSLYETLEYYFGEEWIKKHYKKIIPVTGDIGEYKLGLDNEYYKEILNKIDTVYHCAADVRHYADENVSMHINVGGTKNVIAFCEESCASLGHISTLSVGGERICNEYEYKYGGMQEVKFDEQCYDIGQNWRDNVYVRSKFFAEREVLRAARNGLKAKIIRVGRLVGRACDGKFQKNKQSNYFYNVITGISRLGAVPAEIYETSLEITPVDKCAEAAVLIMDGKPEIIHLANPNEITIGNVAEVLMKNDPLRPSLEEFTGMVLGNSRENVIKSAALLNTTMSVNYDGCIRVKVVCDNTNKKLERLGFLWGDSDIATMLKEFI